MKDLKVWKGWKWKEQFMTAGKKGESSEGEFFEVTKSFPPCYLQSPLLTNFTPTWAQVD